MLAFRLEDWKAMQEKRAKEAEQRASISPATPIIQVSADLPSKDSLMNIPLAQLLIFEGILKQLMKKHRSWLSKRFVLSVKSRQRAMCS
jgi:hypothetical protein